MQLAKPLTVVIEVPLHGMIKRRQDKSIDFIALPSPFNYGSVVGTVAPDGDPLDALVLGPRLTTGELVERTPLAVYGFVDRGQLDPKIVCGDRPLSPAQRRSVERFFRVYARFKRALAWARGQGEPTEVLGWLPFSTRRTR